METIDLVVEERLESGKGPAYRIRTERKVPGILYGPHMDKAVNVALDELQLGRAMKGAHVNSIFKLSDDKDGTVGGKYAMVKHIQLDPVTEKRIHVDLYEVREGEEIKIKVPVRTVGRAKGVREGGILRQTRRELIIKCVPKNIPNDIQIDVSNLDMNQAIHVSDLKLPEGVRVIANNNFTVVNVIPPETEEKKAVQEPGSAAAAAPAK